MYTLEHATPNKELSLPISSANTIFEAMLLTAIKAVPLKISTRGPKYIKNVITFN